MAIKDLLVCRAGAFLPNLNENLAELRYEFGELSLVDRCSPGGKHCLADHFCRACFHAATSNRPFTSILSSKINNLHPGPNSHMFYSNQKGARHRGVFSTVILLASKRCTTV